MISFIEKINEILESHHSLVVFLYNDIAENLKS